MSARPGSWPWLLGHELRLAWRNFDSRNARIAVAFAALVWIAVHAGIAVLVGTTGWGTLPPPIEMLFGLFAWFVCTIMVSQAIVQSVRALFERGDFDLLLASPVSPRNVFLVRGVGVAVPVVGIWALLLTPLANVAAVTGRPALLAIYPTLAAIGLAATALGMATTLGLVRVLGARRARIAAQVFGAIVGASLFLALQFSNLVAPGRATTWIARAVMASTRNGRFDSGGLEWLPYAAATGHLAALALLVGGAGAAFALVIAGLARRFLAGTQEPMTAAVAVRNDDARPRAFRGGVRRAVLVKEWKLIGRDPQLIANTLLQSLYVLPLAFLWMRDGGLQGTAAPTMVLLASLLASGLAWITVAAEDAPELLASAPVDRDRLRRDKLLAALVPVWLVMAPLAIVLARSNGYAAAVFVPCLAGATVASASLQLAFPRTGRRGDLRRRGKGNLAASVFEVVTTIAWTATAWTLLHAPWFAAPLAVLAIGAPMAAWRWGRRQRSDFSAA